MGNLAQVLGFCAMGAFGLFIPKMLQLRKGKGTLQTGDSTAPSRP